MTVVCDDYELVICINYTNLIQSVSSDTHNQTLAAFCHIDSLKLVLNQYHENPANVQNDSKLQNFKLSIQRLGCY